MVVQFSCCTFWRMASREDNFFEAADGVTAGFGAGGGVYAGFSSATAAGFGGVVSISSLASSFKGIPFCFFGSASFAATGASALKATARAVSVTFFLSTVALVAVSCKAWLR